MQLLRQHIQELCERWEINIEWCDRPSRSWGGRELDLICIAPVRSAISYATALHEIGHVMGRHQGSRSTIVRERWAWHWAKANALSLWTPRMQQAMCGSLTWYEKRR